MILIDHSTLSQGAQRGLRWEGLRCYCFLHRVRYQIHVTKIIVYFKWMIKVKWLHWYKYGLHHSYFKLPNCITNEILSYSTLKNCAKTDISFLKQQNRFWFLIFLPTVAFVFAVRKRLVYCTQLMEQICYTHGYDPQCGTNNFTYYNK